MKKTLKISFAVSALLLVLGNAALAVEPAEMASVRPSVESSVLQNIGPVIVSGTSNITGTLSDTVRSTVSGTVFVASTVGNAVADTVVGTVVGTANVAGAMGNVVTGSVRNTYASTVSVASAVTNVVADTLSSTLTGSFNVAGSVTHVVADTVGGATRSLIVAPKKMLDYANSLIGTPYKWGGTSIVNGLDCSGFVQEVVKTATGKMLPRTAKEMSQAGRKVNEEDMKPGDLVFFNTRKQPFSHVGIYIGDGEFIHGASGKKSGKQVRIDRLENSYFSKRYNGARRVANPPELFSKSALNMSNLFPRKLQDMDSE